MARYDYKCSTCGNVFEVEHAMGEHPSISCPSCGNPAERLFSASGIVLSGSGFYNTDQRGHEPKVSAKAHDTSQKSHEHASAENVGSNSATDASNTSASKGNTSTAVTPTSKPASETQTK